jgi:hypothetical protein
VAQACATRTPADERVQRPDEEAPYPYPSQSAAKPSDVFMGATKAAPILHRYPQQAPPQQAPTQK